MEILKITELVTCFWVNVFDVLTYGSNKLTDSGYYDYNLSDTGDIKMSLACMARLLLSGAQLPHRGTREIILKKMTRIQKAAILQTAFFRLISLLYFYTNFTEICFQVFN